MAARVHLFSELAELLSCSPSYLYDHLDTTASVVRFDHGRELPVLKLARWVATEAQLAKFLDEVAA